MAKSHIHGAALGLAALFLVAPHIGRAQTRAERPAPLTQQPPSQAAERTLRVCGDPDNLPFSNEKQEGFENRIIALLAQDLGDSLTYVWWPHRRGFVRNTIGANVCDIVVGVPAGFDPVSVTRPYYRSTYYIVTRSDRKLGITSLDDPQLRTLKVGVNVIGYDYTNTPPAHALAARNVHQLKGYSTFYDDERRPGDIIDAVAKGDVDVALVWGPLAGYYASRATTPLTLTALPDSDATAGIPFAFDIGIGVRRRDRALKTMLDSALVRRADDIRAILESYHVPTLRRP